MAGRDKSPGLFSVDELSGCAASRGTEPAHADEDNERPQEREKGFEKKKCIL